MWPLQTISNKILAITCTPQELTCSFIRPTRIERRYELCAHQCFPLTHGQLERLILFNPTMLRTYIQEFITHHQLAYSSCVVSVTGPSVIQRITTTHESMPTYHRFIDPRVKEMLWDFYYLYCEDDGRYAWYVAGIKQSLVLQFKLLFSTLPIHFSALTTESMALLYAYKQLYGAAFRTTRLSIDMKKLQSNSLDELITHELMRRTLACEPHLHTSSAIRTVLGLFLLGHAGHETN